MATRNSCEDCMNFVYDEEYDCYVCEQSAELDEDEMQRFLQSELTACPFYHPGDGSYYLSSRQ